jgi:hypothetical protein
MMNWIKVALLLVAAFAVGEGSASEMKCEPAWGNILKCENTEVICVVNLRGGVSCVKKEKEEE